MNNSFWAELLAVRGEVNKVLEQARTDNYRGSLEAAVTLYADKALAEKHKALVMNYALFTDITSPCR